MFTGQSSAARRGQAIMRFVDEPIEIELHVSATGQVQPLRFTWRGRQYIVTGQGRTTPQGDNHYFLVMTTGERIFELRWHVADNCWFLARAPGRTDAV
jgi:hypothetical protein